MSPTLDRTRRNSSNNHIRLNVFSDDSSGGNYRALSYYDSSNNRRVGADPDVILDDYRSGSVPLISDWNFQRSEFVIAGPHHYIGSDQYVVTNCYTSIDAGIDVNIS